MPQSIAQTIRFLGGRLYGSEAAGDAPLRDLKAIVRDLIGSGAPADRVGLLRVLRARGHSEAQPIMTRTLAGLPPRARPS
jgi:hypothetical protein